MVRGVVRNRIPVMRGMLVVAGVAILALALPATVAADVTGGCTLTGTSTSGGPVDLTNTAIWHLKSTDRISGTATAPATQYHVRVDASILGLAIPIAAKDQTDGATSAQSDTYDIATPAALGRVFVISGSSLGPHGPCAGQIEIVIDDVNPLLTVMGGGGLAGVLLGLLGLLWAVRRPASGRRLVFGLLSAGALGGGSTLVLQQVLAGGQAEGFARSDFVDAVAGPAQVSLDPAILVQSAVVTLLVIVLLPFPSELFNRTLEENLEEIRSWVRRLPLVGRMVRPLSAEAAVDAPPGRPNLPMIAVFVLVAGLLYGLLDPRFGPDARSFVTYTGIVLALVAVTWAAAMPRRAIHRAAGDPGRLHAVPGTLVVAAACVLVSRLAGFLPGYLYGLLLGYKFAKEFDVPQEGRAYALGAWWMLGLAVVAWLTLGAVRGVGIEGTVPAAIAESVLAALVVAGIEGIVFGLLPLRFLHGEPIFRWRRSLWAVLYAIGLFGFVVILINPVNGFLTASTKQTSVATAIGLFVAFGMVSVVFWAYFRYRPTRPTAR